MKKKKKVVKSDCKFGELFQWEALNADIRRFALKYIPSLSDNLELKGRHSGSVVERLLCDRLWVQSLARSYQRL